MPELPEVEIVRRNLEELLKDQPRITGFEFRRKDLRDLIPIKKLKAFEGSRVLKVVRRAKYLLIETEKGVILSHLGMTGTWRVRGQDSYQKHDHVVMKFSNELELIFRDPRRFGIFETVDPVKGSKRLQSLGPEPWDSGLSDEVFFKSLKAKKSSLKAAIMNQALIVGVGNIYASEALFLAGIRPTRRSDRIKKDEAALLLSRIRQVLTAAIEAGGSTISDYEQVNGQSGYFQDQHLVYGREGESCRNCKSIIRQVKIVGRSTFWCSKCQN